MMGWEAVSRFCNAQTDRFTLLKIQTESFDSPLAMTPLSHSCSQETLSTILSQPFHYLARGGQAFAFVSADGNYVLKLSKRRWGSLYHALAALPLPYVQPIFAKKYKNALQKRDRDLSSYLLAYQAVPDLTGLFYLHLCKNPTFHHTVTLIDKIGIAHTVDLDDTTFVLQQRAEPINHYLKRLESEGNTHDMHLALASLLDTLQTALQRGVMDDDPGLHRNFGFAGNTPLFIDVGRLQPVAPDATLTLASITSRFRAFLQEEHPTLVPVFDEALLKRSSHAND
jgi:hypothetical protein